MQSDNPYLRVGVVENKETLRLAVFGVISYYQALAAIGRKARPLRGRNASFSHFNQRKFFFFVQVVPSIPYMQMPRVILMSVVF